jgi:hypothetical protein
MTAFFFHTAEQPLFGQYGPPSSRVDRDEGVLFCPPVGREYMICHWCLRQLAQDLVQAGFHVFCFDYSCLGDSWGAFEEATLGRWVEDVRAAHQEFADVSGLQKISAIGLRLGAALAYEAAREVPLYHLLLLDPVTDGRAFIAVCRAMQTGLRKVRQAAPRVTPGADFEDHLGYRHSAALVEQLAGLGLSATPLPRADRVQFFLSAPDPSAQRLREQLEGESCPTDLWLGKTPAGWDNVVAYSEPVLLAELRRAVVDALKGDQP